MIPLPDPRMRPKDCVALGEELFGHARMAQWCARLLSGASTAGAPDDPDIAWLRGRPEWPDRWCRVWGARGLLHLGPPLDADVVLSATHDEWWRVREMAVKVMVAHDLPDPHGRVDLLVDDPVDRVRRQAWRAVGRVDGSSP